MPTITKIELDAVCAYFVSNRRRESPNGAKFRYRPSDAVMAAIDARIEALADEFLRKRG